MVEVGHGFEPIMKDTQLEVEESLNDVVTDLCGIGTITQHPFLSNEKTFKLEQTASEEDRDTVF